MTSHDESDQDGHSTHDRERKHEHKVKGKRERERERAGEEEKQDENVEHFHTWPKYVIRKRHMEGFAKYCPLVAAILAPLSTLLDIPALSQRWYTLNDVEQADPKASLILSAIGLALNLFANTALVCRFSAKTDFWWKQMTRISLVSWLGKTIVAVINLILFGILTRNSQGYKYAEGFWCAVISVIDAGIITIALLFHYLFAFGDEKHDNSEVRSEGRRFMLSVTFFFAILGVQSLVFCKIENWSYTDSLYGSVQTALTIGFGDFAPTTTAGKVLVFPFSVLTISQLGNEIALIIGFISARADERRDKWRRRFEGAMHREANARRPRAGLTEEMALIHEINSREEMMSQMYDLMWSALSLIVFWVIGAVLFSQIEGWTYGDAVYTCMILSLTIGFGDFEPVQPAGRVVFIVYALMAVPIVTSFAVQTITGLLSTYTERGAAREAFLVERRRTPEAFQPHADFILHYHDSYGDMRKRLLGENGAKESAQGHVTEDGDDDQDDPRSKEQAADVAGEDNEQDGGSDDTSAADPGELDAGGEGARRPGQKGKADREFSDADRRIREDAQAVDDDDSTSSLRPRETSDDTVIDRNGDGQGEVSGNGKSKSKSKEDKEQQLQYDLLKQLMNRMIQLEAEARQMLLDSMDKGVARTLLLADRNVQVRDVRALRGDDANMLAIWQGEEERTASDRSKGDSDIDADKGKEQGKGQGSSGTAASGSGSGAGAGGTSTTPESAAKGQLDMLSRVRRYRNTFAEVLVLGSILQKLEGEDLNRFERWRTEDQADEQRQRQEEQQEENEDIHRVADEKWGGLTGKIFKRHATKIGRKDFDFV